MGVTIQYYDLVLLGILVSLLLGVVVSYVTGLSTALTVPAAAVLGIALIYHTLFLRGPVNSTEDLSEEAREIDLPK
ncbi:hypothetical protein [Natrinema salifodinae]|uniref:Uncharacterized protein n=1 Tax=Natrinema salifodinae TaxID=1202768 RepID=A0A1I0Q429_9EURY|nr:hypothetical protein [Natrinema salifodinae]SEW21649.1 hypothetical protein SAMN05216285_3044 [Natrinema salifodinae]